MVEAYGPLKRLICETAYDIPYDRYNLIDSIIHDDPDFHMGFDRFNMSLSDRKSKSCDVTSAVETLSSRLNLTRQEKHFVYTRLNQYCAGGAPLDLMYNAFRLQASPAQNELYLDQIVNQTNGISLGIAISELGHGTEVNKLETTAFYDVYTDEFVINSPTRESMKWYTGSSDFATHLLLFAQLIIGGRSEGIMPFFVQIRDMATLELLSGVRQGDIGPRAGLELSGYNYFIFSNLRIPGSALLQRYTRIEKGKLVLLHPQARSLVMTSIEYLRGALISWSWRPAALSLTIAIRYSEVRRQFNTIEGSTEERKVLDYQLQQLKLVPALASCFAQLFGGKEVIRLADEYTEASALGHFEKGVEVSALTSSCKAFYTWTTLTNLEVCRQACGGHGYSSYSGIPQLFLNYMPTVTFEGDNTVLAMIPARALLVALQKQIAGSPVLGDFGFLVSELPLPTDPLLDSYGTQLLGCLTGALTRNLFSKTQKLAKAGLQPKAVGESYTQLDSIQVGKAYCYYFTHKAFAAAIRTVADATTARLLNLLRQVYFVTRVCELGGAILRERIVSPAVFKQIKASLPVILKELRPNLQLIVSSFDFSDTFLCSALGRKDGQVYEALLALAKSNPVNKTQPHPGILKYVKPLARL